MGIGAGALGVIGTLVSVAGTAIQFVMQRQAQKKQEKAEREAREISQASERNKRLAARRKALRERRVILSKIQQSAENTGVGGSSGELGAAATLGTNLGENLSQARSQELTTAGLSRQSQNIADARSLAQQGQAFGSIFQAAGQFISSDPFGFASVGTSGTGGTTRTAPSGQVRGFQFGRFGGGV